MSFAKLKKLFVDSVLLPTVGTGFVIFFWCILSALTYDMEAKVSDFPSPITTWNESVKYFVNPFSSNSEEGFDGIGLETWRSLKLVAMGYGMAILAAIPIGFLLGGSKNFARMFDPIFQVLRPISPLAWFPLAGLIVIAIRRHNREIDATQLQCIFTIAHDFEYCCRCPSDSARLSQCWESLETVTVEIVHANSPARNDSVHVYGFSVESWNRLVSYRGR